MVSGISSVTLGIQGEPIPSEGERVVGPFTFVFADANPIHTNLTQQMASANLISYAKSIYIDNSGNTNEITMQWGIQPIKIPPSVQGWIPVVSQRPIIFSIQCAGGSGRTVILIANYLVAPYLYATT
jgi:hypothetical protein